MIETAELVAERYGISRAAQDEYALQSQQRTAAAQAAGRFDAEIVPLASVKQLFDKEGKPTEKQPVTLAKDEGNRADTTLESLSALKPVWKNGQWVSQGAHITAGNASQLSDGAAATLLMSRAEAQSRGLLELGRDEKSGAFVHRSTSPSLRNEAPAAEETGAPPAAAKRRGRGSSKALAKAQAELSPPPAEPVGEGMAEKAPEKKASRGRRARKPQTAPDGGASAA